MCFPLLGDYCWLNTYQNSVQENIIDYSPVYWLICTAILLLWSKGMTLLPKTSKLTTRKYQRNKKTPEPLYTDSCLIGSLEFISLCSSCHPRQLYVIYLPGLLMEVAIYKPRKTCQMGKEDWQANSDASGWWHGGEYGWVVLNSSSFLFHNLMWGSDLWGVS